MVQLVMDDSQRNKDIKTCPSCHRTLPTTNFGSYWKNRDGFTTYCQECSRQKRRIRYRRLTPTDTLRCGKIPGAKPIDDIDPAQFRHSLRDHNLMKLTELDSTRPFRWPSYPYKKLVRLYHVDTEAPHILRIFMDSDSSTQFKVYDSKDKLIRGFIFGEAYSEAIKKVIVAQLFELKLRVMWG